MSTPKVKYAHQQQLKEHGKIIRFIAIGAAELGSARCKSRATAKPKKKALIDASL